MRRWIDQGRVPVVRTEGGQRTVKVEDVHRLMAQRRGAGRDVVIVAQSARNRFPGVITSVKTTEVTATVEVQAGPHRLVSLITRESVDELDLRPGRQVICVVKATDVIVEVPS